MKTLWPLFFQGIGGGLAAFVMPCIFPLLPLTISFFTKSSSSRFGAITKALLYGLSIVVIYCALGLIVTAILGPSGLNSLASSAFFNLFIFFLLVLFAISFFGAFDINLPSGLVNKIDGLSGGQTWIGIFFMAFTLSLVSFSCTAPLVGTLLFTAVSSGQYYALLAAMVGFSTALALPFTLAAIFPSLLKALPKSGSWLNSVKVFLGFIELAAAMKFLSNFDLTYHTEFLNREVFLSIWIALFTLLGFYLIGKIKFSHDSDLKHLSVFRFFTALATFSFVAYLIPGLWGAPLKSLSGFLPPLTSQEFILSQGGNENSITDTLPAGRKLVNVIKPTVVGFHAFFDYKEGLAYARKVNKPVMLDFTGHSCVNCRKMEASVWTNPEIKNIINRDYILISLYVDEKLELPSVDQYTSKITDSKVKTIGNLNSDIEASKFGTNSQPYYVLLDKNEKVLGKPRAYDENLEEYKKFLMEGLQLFHQNQK